MVQGWVVLAAAVIYIGILFAVANYGDAKYRQLAERRLRPYIYAFSLAIYCTTWTFFGSVGFAASSGLSFVAIYLGPILMITIGFPILLHVVRLSKGQRITSVADFIGARFGKNALVGGVAAVIAVIGTLPYIAVQLKAISSSVSTLISHYSIGFQTTDPGIGDISLVITVFLALFTVLFGTRHADATEHQNGLMLAVAMESVVKLAAFLAVGLFVTYSVFDGVGDILVKASKSGIVTNFAETGFNATNFVILTFLSGIVFLLLPRQFHVAIVENKSGRELNVARWLFPLYLVLINLFVIPVAFAGLTLFADSVPADSFVLAIPMEHGADWISLFVFVGGLSAGTAMVIVASVALAIMVSNQIVIPIVLKRRGNQLHAGKTSMEQQILNIRRTTIVAIILAAYAYFKVADNTAALVSIGLVSFAAIAQLAPSFFIGIYWRRANARGALLGMSMGFVVWAYSLLLPTVLPDSHTLMLEGLFGIAELRPQHLFNLELSPISNGIVCSLFFNVLGLVIGSLSRDANGLEKLQASAFAPQGGRALPGRSLALATISVGDLIETVSQYLGEHRARRAFQAHHFSQNLELDEKQPADPELLQFSEQLLGSAVGASSSRLIHSLLIKRHGQNDTVNKRLLDEASEALQYNRGVLQSALDQIEHGICVLDDDYRLSSWNSQFRKLLNLPVSVGTAGTSFSSIIAEIVERNELAEAGVSESELAHKLANLQGSWQLELPVTDRTIEVSQSNIPQGGSVYTWNDITEKTRSAKALLEANELLEKRVNERTAELTSLNEKLADATQDATRANKAKTRFLAAVGHDILQPLNAARLYCATLMERMDSKVNRDSALSINRSLDSVEEILSAVLVISRLDTGNVQPQARPFELNAMFDQLKLEFAPIADAKNLELRFVETTLCGHTEAAMFKRLLQNLISNAIKYTDSGKVVVGCRRKGEAICVQVLDTGIGINPNEQDDIFAEFKRLHSTNKSIPGLGLGLSIVERISKRLDLKVELSSTPGQGTVFGVTLPSARSSELKPRKHDASLSYQIKGAPVTLGSNFHVLCVDNDKNILKGMAGLLKQWGCRVTVAQSSDEALEKIRNNKEIPQVILMDYHLDEETGLQAIQKICAQLNSDINAIMITADRSAELRQQAQIQGYPIINKPVKPAALRSALSSFAKAKQAAE